MTGTSESKSNPCHPAFAVTNINSAIKVTLDMESGQYVTWSELFKIHARAHQTIDHIIPPKSDKGTYKESNPELWARVDAIVLQWIYGTISFDLLNTIIEPDTTAARAWNRLKDIFSDNKNSRALYLEQEFSRTQMEDFADASSYCQHLKSLADQLYNVGNPVSNERMVLQLVSGLPEEYATVGSQIRHGDTLPPFYKARSMLVLEETARSKRLTHGSSQSALTATDGNNSQSNYNRAPHSGQGRGRGRGNKGKGRNTNGSNGGNNNSLGGGSGIGHGGGRGTPPSQQYPPPNAANPWWFAPPYWNAPPCPYPTAPPSWPRPPTAPWQRPPATKAQPVYNRPQQAHLVNENEDRGQQNNSSQLMPTDIKEAVYTMELSPPNDQWFMDTGATSHMTGFSDWDGYNEM